MVKITQIIRKDKRWIWLVLGLLAMCLRLVLGYFPAIVETIYSRGVFQLIRYSLNAVIGLLPFPSLYLWVVLLIVGIVFFVIGLFKNHTSWWSSGYHLIMSLLALAGAVVFFFLFLWGYNYARIPIENQVGISPEPLSKSELFEELTIHTERVSHFRNEISNVLDTALTDPFLPADLEAMMRSEVKRTMGELGYPTAGVIRGRPLFKGSLLRIGTAGFYLPLTGECHIDDGLHALQKPYVMAHEFAHGFGIGDEGSCNFIAYLTCISSENAFVRYSGNLSFWRSVATAYLAYDPAAYRTYRDSLPPGIINDLNAINENGWKYPDIFPELRDRTYDAFLRTQGIAEGMKNYSRVILLERAWRLEKEGEVIKE